MPEALRDALADRYLVERELGRGGMAVVYLAQDLRHGRPVALKVLLPELAASLGPERFQREIHFAARLQHPHILTVLDSGEGGGRLWFAMPFVEGESLRERLRRERQLPVDDALRIAIEAARALDYAHRHDVVHRDIKPENILLTRDGDTLVADFGIARALAGGEERLTETGLAVGTPAYMSPEQAAGDRALDARSDIYSLAAVLYEMLAGEPPYTGPTAQAIAAKRLTEAPPSVRVVRPAVPESVDDAIRKALAPVAADRFTSAAQLAQALQATGAHPAASAPSTGRPRLATTVVSPSPGQSAGRRRAPPALLTLLVGLGIGVGILFAWRHSRSEPAPAGSGERRIAVLPFQNVGDSADAYFADGIADAVRGKLTAIPGLRVTAFSSSAQYRNTTKSPQEIGRELGVDYLLVGRVRWAKGVNGSRVQVSPELIDVATASAKWQQPFDAALTDVFRVQADVAGQVAQALDVEIGARQREALAARPTQSLEAYDAYLKGKAARGLGPDPVTLRQAIGFQQRAVALDSGFQAAWAELSESSSLLWFNGAPSPALAEQARAAAEHAIALDPRRADGYRALAGYERKITGSATRALEYYAMAHRLAPEDAETLHGMGGAEFQLGRYDDALEHMRRAHSLDPRSPNTGLNLSLLLLWRRQYDEALAAADEVIAIAPTALGARQYHAMVHLALGDLQAGRAELAQLPPGVDPSRFVAYMATAWDLYWPLDPEQRALLKRLRPAAFDGDVGIWGLALAGAYEVEGDRRRAAAYGDSARVSFEQQLRSTPASDQTQLLVGQRNVLLGVALAYAGRKDEAIRAGLRGATAVPLSSDAFNGAYYQHQLARIYVLVGEPEKALDQLERLLEIPYYLSPGWLRIDPTFDPLRKNPRFMKLVQEPRQAHASR